MNYRGEAVKTKTEFWELYRATRDGVDNSNLWRATEDLLGQFDIALELLQGCIRDGGAISVPLYEGIEKFVGRHTDDRRDEVSAD